MIISVASGKGGTGKTTVAVNLALVLENVQFLDCDVEEPNAGLFLNPDIRDQSTASIPVPVVDKARCRFCGKCQEVCAYNAIAVLSPGGEKGGEVLVFPQLCHGCGACHYLCPQKAISEANREIGKIEVGNAGDIQFVQGRLNVGEAMSPPLIRQVKAHVNPTRTVIIDAPPGTSCPVMAAVQGTDLCLLVTEPTPFGKHDLVLAVEALRKLRIPFGVVMNRSDIGNEEVDRYCREQDIPVLMRIPFKKDIAAAYAQGIPLIRVFPEYRACFKEMFLRIRDIMAAGDPGPGRAEECAS